MNKRTKYTAIPMKVKKAVYIRDGCCCIFCHRNGFPEAHYISRSRGGLGIVENIVTLCRPCHERLDQSSEREELLKRVKEYLDTLYPDFTEEQRIYRG